ncbi:hypothetical protein M8J76_009346 [Diaphorina citri]|nr:hypothetical protein M8J76_009346 [Diaphorina citri]
MSTKSNIVRIEIPTSSSIFIRSNTNRETVVTIQHDNEENNVVIIASPERHKNRIGESNTHSCQNPMSSENVSSEEIEGQSKNLEPMERMSSEEIEGQSKNLQPMERMSSEEIEGLSKNLQPMGRMSSEEIEGQSKNLQPMERMSSEEIEGLSKNLELMESNRTELRKTGKKIVVTDKRVTRSAARIIGKISSNMVLRSGTKLSKCDQYKVRNGLRKHASKEILRTNRNVGKENTPLVTKEREDKLNTTNSRNIDGEIKENKLRKLPIRPGTRVIITRAMARIITRRQARSKGAKYSLTTLTL